MKNSIFTTAFALLVLSSNFLAAGNENRTTGNLEILFYGVTEKAVLNPDTVLSATEKTMSEIIAEDKQITESESSNAELAAATKTVREIILEDNQIIESGIIQIDALNFQE